MTASSDVVELTRALVGHRTEDPPGREIELARFVHDTLVGRATLAVGTVSGGSAVNLTPDRAEAGADVRYLPGTARELLVAAVSEAAGEGVGVELIDDKPPVETPLHDPFVATCLAALASERGEAGAPRGVSYFSDSNVLCPALGIPRVLIGPGPLGRSGQRDEHVPVEDPRAAVEVYEHIARGWPGRIPPRVAR